MMRKFAVCWDNEDYSMQGLDRPFHLKDFKDRLCPSNISQEAKALHESAHDRGIDRPAPEAGSAKTWDLGTIGEVIGRVWYSVSTSVKHQSTSLSRLLSEMRHH